MGKWVRQTNVLQTHLANLSKMSIKKTPIPEKDPRAVDSTLWARTQETCGWILKAWEQNAWFLGANLWVGVEALGKEAYEAAKAAKHEDETNAKVQLLEEEKTQRCSC